MTNFIFCLATDPAHAQAIIQALSAVGIVSDQVSVLAVDKQAIEALAGDLHAHVAHGSFAGGNVGGAIGWLAGLSTLAIPGIGLFVAAGPILGFLAGIAVGGSMGNLNGAMIEEMGIPDTDVPLYEEAMNAGRIVISVRFENDGMSTQTITALNQAGAQMMGTTGDHYDAVPAVPGLIQVGEQKISSGLA